MELFLAGLILGALGYRFLGRFLHGRPSFDWFMQKELGAERLPAAGEALEKRVACLEEQLKSFSGAAAASFSVEKAEVTAPPAVVPDQPLLYPGGRPHNGKQQGLNRRAARGNVIALWREGKKIDDIATRTRLGRGEVELIINLQGKMNTPSRKADLSS